MAVTASRRWFTLLIICTSHIVSSQDGFKVPDVTIQALKPKGFRAFIPDAPNITLFIFQGRVNKAINQNEVGEIEAEVTSPKDGRWIYEDPNLELKVGDTINYYVFVSHNLKGYLADKLSFTVTELVEDNLSPPGSPNCRPTVTLLRTGTACAGETIFEDHFHNLREDLWQIEQYVPDQPEFPFVSYQRPPMAQTVTVRDGNLRIEPKLQQEQPGFNNESLYSGSLNLFSGCTRTAEACSMRAWGASILPPIVSGRITSKTFAFTYGIVEVRAKLPEGDWLYPEILLESLIKKYGTINYASGVIRIVGALGNRRLKLGSVELGNKILYGGAIMDTRCKETLIGKKELLNGRIWSDDFHLYSVRWAPDRLTFMVDGEEWLSIYPAASGLQGRFDSRCEIPRPLLSMGSPMAPFDDHFQLTLGVAAGGITEFKDNVISGERTPKPWSNRNRKASLNFWRDLSTWKPTWRHPGLVVDYVKMQLNGFADLIGMFWSEFRWSIDFIKQRRSRSWSIPRVPRENKMTRRAIRLLGDRISGNAVVLPHSVSDKIY